MDFIFTLLIAIGIIMGVRALVKRFPNVTTPMSIHAADAERELLHGKTPLDPIEKAEYSLTDKEEREWQSLLKDLKSHKTDF